MISADVTTIAIRESLEAFLIISILAGLVSKIGRKEAKQYILWGAGAAVAFSIVVGTIIHSTVRGAFESSGAAELFEGVASLIAVGILTYMIIWMYRHTMSMVGELRKQAHDAIDAGRPAVLFALAFVAIAREGLETALFVATQSAQTSGIDIVLSLLLGITFSSILAFLLFTGIIRLSVQKFFAITGLLLIFFAGGLLATSVHELGEAGVVPETPTAWNTEPILDQHSLIGSMVKAVFGYREAPTVLEALAYFGYVVGLGVWYARGLRGRGRRGRPAEQAASPATPSQ